MKKLVLLLVVAVALVVASLAGAATKPLAACNVLHAGDLQQTIHSRFGIHPAEGTITCNIFTGDPQTAKRWIVVQINSYDRYSAQYIRGLFRRGLGRGLQRVSSLGPLGAVLVFPDGRRVTVYFRKHAWFVAVQAMRGVTEQQTLALAKIAYKRL